LGVGFSPRGVPDEVLVSCSFHRSCLILMPRENAAAAAGVLVIKDRDRSYLPEQTQEMAACPFRLV
jgi:hypothetical protein